MNPSAPETPSTSQQISSAVWLMATLTLIVKGVSFLKEIVLAQTFGRGDGVDAFLLALLLPAFLLTVVAGALQVSFVQEIHRLEPKATPLQFRQFLFSQIGFVAVVSLGLGIIMIASWTWIAPLLTPSFSAEKRSLCYAHLQILAPTLAFLTSNTLMTGFLNSRKAFRIAALTPMATPIATLFCILVIKDGESALSLSYGFALGTLIEFVIFFFATLRETFGKGRAPSFTTSAPIFLWRALLRVWQSATPLMAGFALLASSTLVDNAFAAALGGGQVAALGYGTKLVALIIGIAAFALSSVALPHFSSLAAQKKWRELRRSGHHLSLKFGLLSFAAVALLMVQSEWIIRIVFERGAFSSADTKVVAQVQTFALLQVPFYLVFTIQSRLFSALDKNKHLMIICAVHFAFNFFLDAWLSQKMGVGGIALASSLAFALSSVVAFFLLRSSFRKIENGDGENG